MKNSKFEMNQISESIVAQSDKPCIHIQSADTQRTQEQIRHLLLINQWLQLCHAFMSQTELDHCEEDIAFFNVAFRGII